MKREIRDLLCELAGVLWTVSSCDGDTDIRTLLCDYAERVSNILLEEDNE